MIIGQAARADASGDEAADVGRVHPIMDPFVGPWRFGRGDGGLQVCNSKINRSALELHQRMAPDVIETERPRYWSVRFLCKRDVLARVAHVRFVQMRVHRVGQGLINAAAGHHIAAEKKAHDFRVSFSGQTSVQRGKL